MEQLTDFDEIKKHYGEHFAKMCRVLFPTILENKGVLPEILKDKFPPNHSLYYDLQNYELVNNFKLFILELYNQKVTATNEEKPMQQKEIFSPQELMRKAGYTLIQCKTNKDVESFKKYWNSNEELCTFRDDKRINNYLIFFAIKDGAENLIRGNFMNPKRQDEYGTSVISIQFSKGNCNSLSIKNRYNHSVDNPDATFSNNLNNIIDGLTDSFVKYYNLNIKKPLNYNFEIPNYVITNDGKYYKYNIATFNIYYCPNNIIVHDGIATQINKARFELIETDLLDLKEKKFVNNYPDFFPRASLHHEITNIKNIKITNNGKEKNITITTTQGENKLKLNKFGALIGFSSNYITKTSNEFLASNLAINNLEMPLLKQVGKNFLRCNNNLKILDLPNLEIAEDEFLNNNKKLEVLNLPNLTNVGNGFCTLNTSINKINTPLLQTVKDAFLRDNNSIKFLDLQNLKSVGHNFLHQNTCLEYINTPKLETIGMNFLSNNINLKNIDLPNVKNIDSNFLLNNQCLKSLNAPILSSVKNCFLYSNNSIQNINFPLLTQVGDSFCFSDKSLKIANISELKTAGSRFLQNCENIENINLPNIKILDDNFMANCLSLKRINLPNAIIAYKNCFKNCANINKADFSNLKKVGDNFLTSNKKVASFSFPNLKSYGRGFFGETFDCNY